MWWIFEEEIDSLDIQWMEGREEAQGCEMQAVEFGLGDGD